MDNRGIRDRMVCRLYGKDVAKSYTVNDALAKLDKLIWKTANNFHMKVQHLDIEDLYQQGALGVLTAWQKFDEKQPVAFITYANWWILKFIQTFCSAMEYSITLNSQNQKLYKELCNNQGLSADADFKHTPRNDALALLAKTNNAYTKHLDKDEFSEEDVAIEATETTQNGEVVMAKLLGKLKETLPIKEYYVVVASSGLVHDQPMTVAEISERLDVTREYVRQTKTKHAGIVVEMLASFN
jgi:RNA polymerase sigma factor (sigma-70 family)